MSVNNLSGRKNGLDSCFKRTYKELSLISKKIKLKANSFIIWEWTVRPYPDTQEYTICINYEKRWPPRVWIVVPDISLKNNLPHVFSKQKNRLCLYHDNDWQWHSYYKMRDTILVWSLMWIVYYEDFCITDKWRGPEAEHYSIEHCLSEKIDYPESQQNSKKKKQKKESPIFLRDYPIRLKND
jgi:hypothetical protein